MATIIQQTSTPSSVSAPRLQKRSQGGFELRFRSDPLASRRPMPAGVESEPTHEINRRNQRADRVATAVSCVMLGCVGVSLVWLGGWALMSLLAEISTWSFTDMVSGVAGRLSG